MERVLRHRTDTLPLLVQWKMLGGQVYVVGLEPGAALLVGRAELLRRNEAPMLAPGQTRSFEVEIGVLEDRRALGDANLSAGRRRLRLPD